VRDGRQSSPTTSYGELRREVAAELAGARPLEPLLEMPGVTDVLVTVRPRYGWIGGSALSTAVTFPDDAAVRRLAQQLAAGAGRRLDDASPFVDAALPDAPATCRLAAVTAHPRFRYGFCCVAGSRSPSSRH
jgi:pilus assembly protein CpaF